MLKMFTTQLQGLFKRIQENEELSFEDGARLLAQAAVGDGKIYIIGLKEMKTVELEALFGAEPFHGVEEWKGKKNLETLTDADRVILISRFSDDEEAIEIGKWISEKGIPFVAIASQSSNEKETLADIADVHIDLRLTKGLLPDEEGNRFGYPSSMAALYAYYGLKFIVDEILQEYGE